MKAFARLHWRFYCGKTLSTTYSMLLWKLFGLFSLRFPGLRRSISRVLYSPTFKGLISNQKEIYIWSFCSSNTLHLRSHISNCILTEPTNLSFACVLKLPSIAIMTLLKKIKLWRKTLVMMWRPNQWTLRSICLGNVLFFLRLKLAKSVYNILYPVICKLIHWDCVSWFC